MLRATVRCHAGPNAEIDMRYARFDLLLLLLLAACSGQDPAAPTTGSLQITISGLSVPATIGVRGAGFTQTVTASTTLENLAPGTYTISAPEVTIAGARYAPDSPLSSVVVVASATPTEKSVAYVVAAHRLVVTVSGLPTGASAQVHIAGPQSFNRFITATDTVWVALAGTYTITAGTVQDSGKAYAVTPATSTVTVTESTAPTETVVSYALVSAPFVITVSGLPDTVAASITVTGPGNFTQTITATTTLWPWLPGSYVIHADDALVSNRTYEPEPSTSTVTATNPPSPIAATVAYAAATVASITVTPATATAVISGSAQLAAITEDARAHPLRNQVTWTSADNAIATVDTTGNVRGVSAGTTTVTATADGVSASAVVTVPPPTVYHVAGTWTFSLRAREATALAQCNDAGTIAIAQAPAESQLVVTGTQGGTCTVRGASPVSFPPTITTGGTAANLVSFSLVIRGVGGCRLEGTAYNEPADRIAGTVSCTLSRSSSTRSYHYLLTGTWTASRVP